MVKPHVCGEPVDGFRKDHAHRNYISLLEVCTFDLEFKQLASCQSLLIFKIIVSNVTPRRSRVMLL